MARILPNATSARHVETALDHDLDGDGISDAAHAIYSSPADDRLDLVRADLIDAAKRASLRCVALVLATASTSETWTAASADLRGASIRFGSRVAGLRAAYEAAEALASNDLDGAIEALAASCGMAPEEWLRTTRQEQGR